MCGDKSTEIVDDINYQGILFSTLEAFKKAKQKQVETANKACFEILKKNV